MLRRGCSCDGGGCWISLVDCTDEGGAAVASIPCATLPNWPDDPNPALIRVGSTCYRLVAFSSTPTDPIITAWDAEYPFPTPCQECLDDIGCWWQYDPCPGETETDPVYVLCTGVSDPPPDAFTYFGVCYSVGSQVTVLPGGATELASITGERDSCAECQDPDNACCQPDICAACPSQIVIVCSGVVASSVPVFCEADLGYCSDFTIVLEIVPGTCRWEGVESDCGIMAQCTGGLCDMGMGTARLVCVGAPDAPRWSITLEGQLPANSLGVDFVCSDGANLCTNCSGWSLHAESGLAGQCECPNEVDYIVTMTTGLLAGASVSVL